jgi:SH3 domain protein
MYRSAAVFFSILLASLCSAAETPVRYIRDWMAVPLHATAEPDSKTVHSGLVSGTAVTVLEGGETNSEYSRVRTAQGVVGWIATRYLTPEPVARVQLEKANAELEELRKLKSQLAALPADMRTTTQQVLDLRGENARLQAELSDSRKTPTEAAQLSAENTRLKADNAALEQRLTGLNAEIKSLHASGERTQFRDGALAVVVGMLIALVVRRFWPKKRSEWS